MDSEDRRLEEVERDASPERFNILPGSTPGAEETLNPMEKSERHETMERTISGVSSSSSGSSSSGHSIERREMGMSRTATQPDLERHPTALSRIQTGRSQHSATVGASLRSRTATRHSRTALPAFGAGKPYPPNLPDREEYVVSPSPHLHSTRPHLLTNFPSLGRVRRTR